jgi:hypothetical protein
MQAAFITYIKKTQAKAERSQKQAWYAIRQDVKDGRQENRTALVHKN